MRSMSGKGKESYSSTAYQRHFHAHSQQVNQCKSDHAVVSVWISLSQPQCLMGYECAVSIYSSGWLYWRSFGFMADFVYGTRVVDLSKTWMVYDQYDCHLKNKWLQVLTCPQGFAEAGRRGNKVKAAIAGQLIPHHPSLRSCSHSWPVTQRKACRIWWTDAALSTASELDWVRGRLRHEIIY